MDFAPIDSADLAYEFDAPRFTDFSLDEGDAGQVNANEDAYFFELKGKENNNAFRPTNLFKKDEPSLIGCESEDDPEAHKVPIRKSSRAAARRSSLVARADAVVVAATLPAVAETAAQGTRSVLLLPLVLVSNR